MPRRFFRRHLPTPTDLRGYRSLRFALGNRLHDPDVWHLNRRSVSGAFAVGLFVAWIPLPIQMVTAAALALLFRVNLPLAVVTVWVSNPFTMAPMYWSAWKVGTTLLDAPQGPVHFEFSLDWLTHELIHIWQPLGLGCLLLGTVSAAAGYVVIRVVWRVHVVRALLHRRRRRRARKAAEREAPARHRD